MVDKGSTSGRLVLPMGDDMHTHLRQGELMDAVVPHLRKGGCNRVLVMPNTVPPIVTCSQALEYRNELLKRDPKVNYLMTLYLCPDVDPHDLAKNAKASHVVGVKLYPRGVTTNSEAGVEVSGPSTSANVVSNLLMLGLPPDLGGERQPSRSLSQQSPWTQVCILGYLQDLTAFDGVFEALQRCGLSLHIHAESPTASALKAEEMFLPTFEQVHQRFPNLKIVFEHISTAAAVEAVKGKQNVAATITAHHLRLTTADVWGPEHLYKSSLARAEESHVLNPHNFCKPLAKCEEDRQALLSYLADIFAREGCLDKLRGFACEHAAAFFGIPKKELVEGQDCVVLERAPFAVPKVVCGVEGSGNEVVPFLSGSELLFTVNVVPFSASLQLIQ
ncbi:dihydroorotase protein, putative [Eimeria acervulina]|uniref:Dihydroorotase protein, putative n=1 Tax=Eimeria acervulina TaxID=5801 RepID=U6GR86_EIMAC|nr:dihydroorotase protein, putative [Eimeria acervulina]CDI82766.1 dihydroorotase protein, putative [Eimeria acervulina]